jgi:hypothetical protein
MFKLIKAGELDDTERRQANPQTNTIDNRVERLKERSKAQKMVEVEVDILPEVIKIKP